MTNRATQTVTGAVTTKDSTAGSTAVGDAFRYQVPEPPETLRGTNYWVQANALYREEHEEDR